MGSGEGLSESYQASGRQVEGDLTEGSRALWGWAWHVPEALLGLDCVFKLVGLYWWA